MTAPMSRDETTSLLQVASTYDNRNVDGAMVNAWHAVALQQRWTYPLALAAVQRHYGEQTAWIMPGHVTAHIRSERRRPEQFTAAGELEGPRSTSEGRRAALDLFVRMVGREVPAS